MSSSWRARCRPNTVIATRSDLRAFFAVIDKSPSEVTTKDAFEFIAAQRRGRGDGRVVRLSDGEAGLAARTIRRRLAPYVEPSASQISRTVSRRRSEAARTNTMTASKACIQRSSDRHHEVSSGSTPEAIRTAD